jgi:hypothetical protein
MARPEGQTSNPFNADNLFKTLEEWNTYLARHVPGLDGALT